MRPPAHAYLVCATPRSGSTLLSELLRETGVAGWPLEHFEVLRASGAPRQPREYFEGVHDFRVLDRLASLRPPAPGRDGETPETWWRRILADGTTPNGVWGGKLMWGHVDDLLARARELPGLGGADLGSVVDALLGPDVALVHVTRPDKVEQAVSLWRAVQTQSWRSGTAASTECIAYVFEGVDHLRRQIEEHDASWRRWFAERGRPVYEVSYDDLGEDVGLVYVTRPDKAEQAVSLWRAVQTQSWRSGTTATTECIAYVFAGVDHLRRQIEEHDAAWRRWFADRGRPVYEVSYDDLGEDPRGTTAAVLEALGLPSDGVPEPGMDRQRDERSVAWAERYRAESGARA